MRIRLFTLLMLTSQLVWSQQPDMVEKRKYAGNPFCKHSFTGTVSVGFIDAYRKNFDVPANFERQSTSGFVPIYVKAEYGITNSVSLALTFAWDDFNYNLYQVYSGFNGPIRRPVTDHFRLFSGGATAYYHLGNAIRINRLDPFIGLGFTINNTRHSAYPQGDSTVIRKVNTASLYAKAGARYYITDMFSVFGDIGYDELSLFSLGASMTLHGKSVQRPRKEPNPKL